MIIWLLFIIIIAFCIIGTYLGKERKANLMKKGWTIVREAKFFDKREYLFSKAEYEDVRRSVLEDSFNAPEAAGLSGLEAYKNGYDIIASIVIDEDRANKTLFFRTNGRYTWAAHFALIKQTDHENTYEFSFERWKTRNATTDTTSMNYVLTAVEKAILKYDPETRFELVKNDYDTKYRPF